MKLANKRVFKQDVDAHVEGKLRDTSLSNSKEHHQLPEQKRLNQQNPEVNQPPQQQLIDLLNNYQARRFGDAEKLAVHITQEFPKHQFAWKVLGALLGAADRNSEAVDVNQTAVTLLPEDHEAHSNLANTLRALGRFDEAEASYRQAIALKPDFAEAYGNLGGTLKELGKFDEAEASYKQAIALKPDFAEAHKNLGIILQELERFDEAEASYRQAIELKPDFTSAMDNLLFVLNYNPQISATELYREYEAYGSYASSKTIQKFDHSNHAPIDGRRIRIGYSSPDFRAHSCRFFMEPMLRHHDRVKFELFAYSNTRNTDHHTNQLKSCFDHWVDVTKLSDEAMAQRIFDDEIDILIDMAGHTAGNRLLVFAMRPAPVQISSPIGYGYTTGLKEIDYFIGDENLTPEGSEPYFSEKLFRVPAPFLVYKPPYDVTPAISDLPALRNGYVTFGSLSRTIRLNDPLLKIWKKILDRVPGSRLRLDQKPFTTERMQELFLQRLEGLGIPRERLELTCSQPHWLGYNHIDVTLDCWPHNAGTTTIESLWMGVPVLSKLDRPSMGCVGAAILKPLGLEDWVAENEITYIEKAVAYASNLSVLAKLRASLRQRLEKSLLLNAPEYTQKIEKAYCQILAEKGYGKS